MNVTQSDFVEIFEVRRAKRNRSEADATNILTKEFVDIGAPPPKKVNTGGDAAVFGSDGQPRGGGVSVGSRSGSRGGASGFGNSGGTDGGQSSGRAAPDHGRGKFSRGRGSGYSRGERVKRVWALRRTKNSATAPNNSPDAPQAKPLGYLNLALSPAKIR